MVKKSAAQTFVCKGNKERKDEKAERRCGLMDDGGKLRIERMGGGDRKMW
jgi:hypothetical protein